MLERGWFTKYVGDVCTKEETKIVGFYSKTQPQPLTIQPQYIDMRNRTLQPFQNLIGFCQPIIHSHLFKHPFRLFQIFQDLTRVTPQEDGNSFVF